MVLMTFQDLFLLVYRATGDSDLEIKHAFEEMIILCARNAQYLK